MDNYLLSKINDFLSISKTSGLFISKSTDREIENRENREFDFISRCVCVSSSSLTLNKQNQTTGLQSFINREFGRFLFKTHRFRENLAFSICSLYGRVYAISTCHSLGKIKIQKNGRAFFYYWENISQTQNGCELVKNGL